MGLLLHIAILYSTLALATLYCLFYPILSCSWGLDGHTFRTFLFADPQMEGDARIIRDGWRGKLDLLFNDYYFAHVVWTTSRYLKPNIAITLGDLLSSEYISDEEFQIRLERFKFIFSNSNLTLFNVSGNHDIGYGSVLNRKRASRFEAAFGKLNYMFEYWNHTWVVLNAMNLDEAFDKKLRNQTWDFLRDVIQLQNQPEALPLILIIHIPLHKEGGICPDEPLVLYDYDGSVKKQNMLSEKVSNYLLLNLKPRFVLTGHDHEGCDVLHFVDKDLEKREEFSNPLKSILPDIENMGLTNGIRPFTDINNHSGHIITVTSSETSLPLYEKANTMLHGNMFATREITVRSLMAEYNGIVGMFEIGTKKEGTFSYHFTSCSFVMHTTLWIVVIVDFVLIGVAIIGLLIVFVYPDLWIFLLEKEGLKNKEKKS